MAAATPLTPSAPPPPPSSPTSATEPVEKLRMPPQIAYIIGNEGCERFSFYGMRSILTVFMAAPIVGAAVAGAHGPSGLGFSEADAKATYHLFVSACYFFPLLGGFLADKFLGKYRVILYLSLFYCAGHAALAIWETRLGLYTGLTLIALGAGGIKPCVSAFVGDQFTAKNKSLVNKVYDLFYFIINFGSFFSTLSIPYLRDHYGNSIAFGLPGVLMGIATIVFWLGRKKYRIVPADGGKAGAFRVLWCALTNQGKRRPGDGFLDAAKYELGEELVESAKAAFRVGGVFAAVSGFWALFDQHGSSWVLQAKEMNLDVDVLGYKTHFSASQLSALNPIMVMGLIPLFSFGVYPGIEKLGIKMTPLRRMTLGMVVAGSSFVAVGLIQNMLDHGNKLSCLWQAVPYLLLTMSEIMVSITGLEFAYTQAPRSMKSTIMSLWMLTVAVGNALTAYIEKINVFSAANGFYFFAGLMLALAVVFGIVAARYKVRDYMESDPQPA